MNGRTHQHPPSIHFSPDKVYTLYTLIYCLSFLLQIHKTGLYALVVFDSIEGKIY